MRIGIDGRLWNETGVGRYVRNLVRELAVLDLKNEYVLFVLSKDIERIKNQELGIKESPSTRSSLREKSNWKVVPTDIKWHSIKEQLLLPSVLNKEKLDLMHFTYFSVPIFYTKPFVITIHDLIPYHFPTGQASTLPEPIYELKQHGYKLVVHAASARAAKIITPLQATKEDVLKTLNVSENRVVVTTEGVDMLVTQKTDVSQKYIDFTQNQKYFLYVGNAYPHKNIERMINAFLQLKDEYNTKNLRLVLIGKEDKFIAKVKKQLKDEENVIFFHEVKDADLSYLYHNAVALIAPSLLEGFGLTPLEAIANDCLVLVSDISSFKEVCGDAAFYFEVYDEKSLLKKMVEVYNLDPEKRKEKIEIGRKRLKLFSWKTMAEQTLAIYESSTSIRQS